MSFHSIVFIYTTAAKRVNLNTEPISRRVYACTYTEHTALTTATTTTAVDGNDDDGNDYKIDTTTNHWFRFSSYMDNRFVCYFPCFVCAFFSSFFSLLSLSLSLFYFYYDNREFIFEFDFRLSRTRCCLDLSQIVIPFDFIEWNVECCTALTISAFELFLSPSFYFSLCVCRSLACCRCEHMPTSDCTLCFRIRYDSVANVLLNFKTNGSPFENDLLFRIRGTRWSLESQWKFFLFFICFDYLFFSIILCTNFWFFSPAKSEISNKFKEDEKNKNINQNKA